MTNEFHRLRDRGAAAGTSENYFMNGLIAFALKQRVIMLVLFVATLAGGLFAFWELNIEAYPDPTPPMVDVITQSAGLSAEEIERYQLYYAKNQSLLLDLEIMIKSFLQLLRT